MNRILLIITALLLCSCSFFESISKGEKVAQIGRVVLYKSDIDNVVPRGASPEDSIHFVQQYINSWALKQLMLIKAEEQLPKNEKEVSSLLDEYRTQLLVFRYENRYLEERLDTAITAEERLQYYNDHRESFTVGNGIIKARLIRMHNSSPNLQMVKSLALKMDADNLDALEDLVYNTAYKYDNYGNNWVDMAIVARDMDMNTTELAEQLNRNRLVEKRDSSYSQFLQVLEYKQAGEISPFEYNATKIDEIILSKRKQELLTGLHRDILNNALDNRKLKIIKDEDN